MSYADFARSTFLNMLGTLDRLAAAAQDGGIDDKVLQSRLVDDMFPLELQFRVALNQVLLALRQVGNAQVELETTAYHDFAQVRARIAEVAELVERSAPSSWAAPDAIVDLTLPNDVRFVMSSEADIRDWILPNFYFHVAMAYALLRHAGLAIGKMDFIPHMARHRIDATDA
ncbi:DUF1993 family protein [Sphingomonas sp.]|uniref:DUF1993 family protein n=1 Tax=Sphingomonas sp. TaxID=28214 RepID=UPI001ECCC5DC|nr:DUF1993 family protein [Sphingomonas sp.]MBX3593118.1 DUF1993 family protein [Sphingomonas sp.]